jgi:flavin-dependent dehydrogenase
MTLKTDVAIIGGGPGGSAAAMFLAQQGIRSTIIEKETFPRFCIGESMSGECSGLLRALGLYEKMMAAGHPQKQGVNVYGPKGHSPWFVPVQRRTAEGQLEDISSWSVRRAEFDCMMLEGAVSRGTDLLRAEAVAPRFKADGTTMHGVRVRLPNGRMEDIEAEVTLDVSGQRTFFAHQGVTSDKVQGRYDKQVAIFSQVANPIRDKGTTRAEHPDNTLIFYKEKFHWAWFIPLNDELVSVGVVAPGAYFASKNESKHDYLVRELKELNPELTRRFPGPVQLVEETRAIPNYSYHCRTFTGPGWIAIGDAHRFIDPIFSFGVYVSMREAQLAAPVIRDYLGGPRRDGANPFLDHQERLEYALELVQSLIDGFWEHPLGFAHLLHQSRCRGDIIDLFAGRIYTKDVSPGVEQLRKMQAMGLARAG